LALTQQELALQLEQPEWKAPESRSWEALVR
jgi:hypothetical protein